MNIEYLEGKDELLDDLGFLWEKLNDLHKAKSKFFSERFDKFNFKDRKVGIIKKGSSGDIKVILVKDKTKDKYIGYSISTIDENNIGGIESIYIDSEYRKCGIGEKLMKSSLDWFNNKNVNKTRLGVAVGNEEAFLFYRKFGFYPLVTILERKIDD
ncbi:GNAT family N-acetyltransferase [Abyssisolibacter fermentans]|uniref:GNAT family N-acetyltransferase n=1 Tax=Abyssisolibacter fermentans TaxID=1766203 RepID=UPI0008351C71|nr:GNAT family N-acetyltransferase [Abyssisolibacter fermentans]